MPVRRRSLVWVLLAPLRRLVILVAVGLLLATLLITRSAAGDDSGPRRLVADPLNRLIAWADLNLQLYPRQGAERAVRLDPKLRTGLGRQGARWLATKGTLRERLRYATSLARQDRRELPVLRAAVAKALCSRDRRLRKAAVTAAARGRLPLKHLTKAARAC
jgi:hypothetical protein